MPRRRRKSRTLSSFLGKYWGYLIILVVIIGGLEGLFGPVVVLSGSGVSLLYMLFAAPLSCCAPTNDGTPCKNNARGLLLGCNQVRRHKWDNLKLIFSTSRWAGLLRRSMSGVRNGAATLGALGSAVSGVAAVVAIVVK